MTNHIQSIIFLKPGLSCLAIAFHGKLAIECRAFEASEEVGDPPIPTGPPPPPTSGRE